MAYKKTGTAKFDGDTWCVKSIRTSQNTNGIIVDIQDDEDRAYIFLDIAEAREFSQAISEAAGRLETVMGSEMVDQLISADQLICQATEP